MMFGPPVSMDLAFQGDKEEAIEDPVRTAHKPGLNRIFLQLSAMLGSPVTTWDEADAAVEEMQRARLAAELVESATPLARLLAEIGTTDPIRALTRVRELNRAEAEHYLTQLTRAHNCRSGDGTHCRRSGHRDQ